MRTGQGRSSGARAQGLPGSEVLKQVCFTLSKYIDAFFSGIVIMDKSASEDVALTCLVLRIITTEGVLQTELVTKEFASGKGSR